MVELFKDYTIKHSKKFDPYLVKSDFKLVSDEKNLTHMLNRSYIILNQFLIGKGFFTLD